MIHVKEIVMLQVNSEMESLKKALKNGNSGKARVCARRGAGLAINYWYKNNDSTFSELPAIVCLEKIKNENTLPESIQKAVGRLTAKVNNPAKKTVSTDPLEDCRVIVDYFMHDNI